MQFDEIRQVLIDILSLPEVSGRFLSCIQICELIKENFPEVWNTITNIQSKTQSSSGKTYVYSLTKPEIFIEKTLDYYSKNNGIPFLERTINCINISDLKKITLWGVNERQNYK